MSCRTANMINGKRRLGKVRIGQSLRGGGLLLALLNGAAAQFTSSPLILTERQLTQGAGFGQAIAIGDFNGRGALDVAVSSNIDRVTIFFGENALAANSAITLNGPEASLFGIALAAGDFNGDRRTDLAIGAPIVFIDEFPYFVGRVFVEFGGSTFNTRLDLQITDPAMGDDLGFFGASLAAGDVNSDGLTDLIVGAPERGMVVILFGVSGSTRFGTLTATIQGPPEAPKFGTTVSVGDVNGDGIGDIIVSDPTATASGRADIGRVYVFFGSSTLRRTPDLIITNPDTTEQNQDFGFALATADLDGDGKSDLVIGAPSASANRMVKAGKVHLYLTSSPQFPESPVTFQQRVPQANSLFGSSLAIGDVNRDGLLDIVVGASGESARSRAGAGRIHIIIGGASTNPAAIIEPPAVETDGHFGFTLALADVIPSQMPALELLATAPDITRQGRTQAGVTYVFRAQGT